MKTIARIEALETRIAPATVVPYTDADGDLVRVIVSKGPFDLADLTLSNGDDGQLQVLTLTDPAFAGANVTFLVKKAVGGDGRAHLGFLQATGIDLGEVKIKGDLGRIEAGNGAIDEVPAINSLSIGSMGAYGTATQAAGGDLFSVVAGHLRLLTVRGEMHDVTLEAVSMGSIVVHGSLKAGSISAAGDIQSVNIAKDVVGGNVNATGFIQAAGKLLSVAIGGSLVGGSETFTAAISAAELGTVKVGRDLIGGSANFSGSISSTAEAIGNVTIAGSIRGGGGNNAGGIYSDADLGTVKVGGDVIGGEGGVSGAVISGGKLTALTIGRSLVGGTNATRSGMVSANGEIGPIKVGRDIIGGEGQSSGRIETLQSIARITIGGSLLGGLGDFSGVVYGNAGLGPVKIKQNVIGGAGDFTGDVSSGATIVSVSIGGSLIGGAGSEAAEIFSVGDMGSIKIGRDFIGGSISGAASINESGLIESLTGRIASIAIGGSIIAGTDSSTGTLQGSASIRANRDIGALIVKGSIVGHLDDSNPANSSSVMISAGGQKAPTEAVDLAIGRLSVGGRVENARILAGYDNALTPTNGNAQIGIVTVGGNWIASSLAAGVRDVDGDGFGDADDVVINNAADTVIARIANVTIKGGIIGTGSAGDQFGFIAQQIDGFKVGSSKLPRTPETDVLVNLTPISNDVSLREI